jgi:hypothetical protein
MHRECNRDKGIRTIAEYRARESVKPTVTTLTNW